MNENEDHRDSDDRNDELATQPHDAFFKDFFSDIAHATSFFQGHLPETLVSLVVWNSLALVPGSFVKRSLHQAHSDLLFSANADGGDGEREMLLYLVFEHQTSIDKAMPLRLLGYLSEILLTHHGAHGLPLPPVVCYVLNQGPKEWTVSQRFEDLFQLSGKTGDALLDYLPKFRHVLYDLTQADPAKQEDDTQLRVALQLMKLARTLDLVRFIEWLFDHTNVSEQDLPAPLMRKVLLYAFHGDSSLDVEEIANTIETSKNPKKTAMSLAEQLIEKGKVEGEAKGEARGEAKGVLKGKIQLLEEMLEKKAISDNALAKMDIAELETRFRELEIRYHAKFKA